MTRLLLCRPIVVAAAGRGRDAAGGGAGQNASVDWSGLHTGAAASLCGAGTGGHRYE